jgi:hypothetical protein
VRADPINVTAGLVPAISILGALLWHDDRDGRNIGEQSDAVLRTAGAGHDGER